MYRARRETDLSYPNIAKRLQVDHSSVIYGEQRHAERLRGLP